MKIEFTTYNQVFLKLSWKWLNDPEIKMMTNTPAFTKEEQQNWFKNLTNRIDYKIWGIVCDKQPIGVCGLKNITLLDCEYWGYIGEKNFWGMGIGHSMLDFTLLKAKKIGLQSVWLVVPIINTRAIHLYEKYGFEEEETNSSQHRLRLKLKNIDLIN